MRSLRNSDSAITESACALKAIDELKSLSGARMIKHQKVAFDRPCLEDEQCEAHDYGWLRPLWSVIPMLNIGLDDASSFDGLPLWHCSVPLVDLNGYPLALSFWHEDAFAECAPLVRLELFAGTG